MRSWLFRPSVQHVWSEVEIAGWVWGSCFFCLISPWVDTRCSFLSPSLIIFSIISNPPPPPSSISSFNWSRQAWTRRWLIVSKVTCTQQTSPWDDVDGDDKDVKSISSVDIEKQKNKPVISREFSWFPDFFFKSPFVLIFSWKKRSSHQGKKEVACIASKPLKFLVCGDVESL